MQKKVGGLSLKSLKAMCNSWEKSCNVYNPQVYLPKNASASKHN